MVWAVGNYHPMPDGRPFDFGLLAEGFERLSRMSEDNGDARQAATSWTCQFDCGCGGTEANPGLATVAKSLHEAFCGKNPKYK